ncbi:hypothetical protein GGF50DRAFT_130868 [Schizophyllum commune]
MIWSTLDDRVHDAQHTSKLLATLALAFPSSSPTQSSPSSMSAYLSAESLWRGTGGSKRTAAARQRARGAHMGAYTAAGLGAAMGACTHGSGYGARPAAENGARTLPPFDLHLSRRTLPARLPTRELALTPALPQHDAPVFPLPLPTEITTMPLDQAQAQPRTRRTRSSLSALSEAKDFFTRHHPDDYSLAPAISSPSP